jgi:hypothetical protein
VVGMALGVLGEIADENCKLQQDHSNHGKPSGQMDGKRQGVAASLEPPDLVFCTNTTKTIKSCWDTVAELDWEAESGDLRDRGAPSCAVPFLFVLVLVGQSCAANKRSEPGE